MCPEFVPGVYATSASGATRTAPGRREGKAARGEWRAGRARHLPTRLGVRRQRPQRLRPIACGAAADPAPVLPQPRVCGAQRGAEQPRAAAEDLGRGRGHGAAPVAPRRGHPREEVPRGQLEERRGAVQGRGDVGAPVRGRRLQHLVPHKRVWGCAVIF